MTHQPRLSIFRTILPLTAFMIALGLSAGCSGGNDSAPAQAPRIQESIQTTTKTYSLRPYKEPCQTVNRDFCIVGDNDAGETDRIYADIDGLTFKWGVIVVAEVEATRIQKPNSEVINWEYKLIRLISETPVNPQTEFEITFDQQDIPAVDTCNFAIPDEVSFGIAPELECAPLVALMKTGQPLRGTFQFTGNEAAPFFLRVYSDPIEPYP